jgi:hypothetical protein
LVFNIHVAFLSRRDLKKLFDFVCDIPQFPQWRTAKSTNGGGALSSDFNDWTARCSNHRQIGCA